MSNNKSAHFARVYLHVIKEFKQHLVTSINIIKLKTSGRRNPAAISLYPRSSVLKILHIYTIDNPCSFRIFSISCPNRIVKTP